MPKNNFDFKAKRGPKRRSTNVRNPKELLALMEARDSGLSWRELSLKHGLVLNNGMTARNLYLRAQRFFELTA